MVVARAFGAPPGAHVACRGALFDDLFIRRTDLGKMRGLAGVANVDPLGVEQLPVSDVAKCSAIALAPEQQWRNVPDLVPARFDIIGNRLPYPYHLSLCDRATASPVPIENDRVRAACLGS